MKLKFTMWNIEHGGLSGYVWIWHTMDLYLYSNKEHVNLEFKKIWPKDTFRKKIKKFLGFFF